MNNTLITIAVAALVSGCSLAPVYQRPDAPVTRAWPQGEAYKPGKPAPDAKAAADIQWRDFITDDKLRELVGMALANNRDLRVSTLNIEKARAQYNIDRAALLPKVSAGVDQNASRAPGGTITRQYTGGLVFPSYELDFFGKVRNLSEAGLQTYLGTQEARNAQQIALVSEVATAWLTLAADKERLRLAQDTLKSQQISFELSKRRFDAGATSGLDMYEAQSSVEAARNDMAIYTAQVAADENALALLVGVPVPERLLPQSPLDNVAQLADLPEGVPSAVLQRRPDVVEAERSLQAANANIGVARAAFFPSMTLTGTAGSASSSLSGLFKAGSGAWSFAPQVNLPIFDGGVNSANLSIARTNRDIAVAQYEKSIQSAFREVADALAQRGTMDERLASQVALTTASEKSFKIHEARYEKGTESYLNALVSQRAMYSAQQGLITARLAKATNQITLYKVLGGGWS
ncbi:efflux transporter outer membrane subunit [Pseudoduganella sp. RAF53_2]|uniref:efflux transporter outer membrane subunit n=1 Tax=unclassified Pseudoduganella TaxID=2637179 RepID=UPI003F98B5F9